MVKLLGNTEANGANGVLRNATIAVPLKYLSNFWRSFEMPMIKCRVELKPKLTNHCVLSAADVDNDNAYSIDVIFIISDTKLYVPVVTLSAKDNRKL